MVGSIAIENARIVTCTPPADGGPLRGAAMNALEVIERGHVIVDGGMIASMGAGPAVSRAVSMRIDARGRVLMPAAVDCHTHACWAGERWAEWELKRAGASRSLNMLWALTGALEPWPEGRHWREVSRGDTRLSLLLAVEDMESSLPPAVSRQPD